jgi:chaperone required for assembly of F1-ATPase
MSPTAFERSVYAAKSFVIALALVKKQVTADQASDAAQVEVRSQIEQWGEVEDCQLPLIMLPLLTPHSPRR